MAGDSGTPLPRKLGIKPGSRVILHAAPEVFLRVLGPLPQGAVIVPSTEDNKAPVRVR